MGLFLFCLGWLCGGLMAATSDQVRDALNDLWYYASEFFRGKYRGFMASIKRLCKTLLG